MACPKCGQDTITVVEEKPKASGVASCVWVGLMIAGLGIFLLAMSPILGFIFIGGGLGMVCASGKPHKVIKCSTCGYEKVMPNN